MHPNLVQFSHWQIPLEAVYLCLLACRSSDEADNNRNIITVFPISHPDLGHIAYNVLEVFLFSRSFQMR